MNRPPRWPDAVARVIGDATLVRDEVGESPCSVWRFERAGAVLFAKHSPAAYAGTTFGVQREAGVIDWLQGRLRVPELIAAAGDEQGHAMVTRAVPGRPLWTLIDEPERAVELFAAALAELQALPIAGCPFDSGVDVRLAELERLLALGHVADDATFDGWPGVDSPEALLTQLHARRPAPKPPVFSHGDLGDSNIFVDERGRLAYIDLGRAGLADRWLDIAFACRDLREEIGDEAEQRLLDRLGVADHPERRHYFEMLDELF